MENYPKEIIFLFERETKVKVCFSVSFLFAKFAQYFKKSFLFLIYGKCN